MRASDIREQTKEELEGKLNDIKKNRFTLKFQKAIGQVANTQAIGNLGRDIAMIETLIREKELGINLELKATKTRAKKKTPTKSAKVPKVPKVPAKTSAKPKPKPKPKPKAKAKTKAKTKLANGPANTTQIREITCFSKKAVPFL